MRARPADVATLMLATVLFAAVGLFPGLMPHLAAGTIAFGRGAFGALVLLGLLLFLPRLSVPTDWRTLGLLVLIGLGNAGNWGFYFASIQYSSVAVAVVSLFTYPLLTALLEPLFYRGERVDKLEIAAGSLVVVGVALIVPEWSLRNNATLGVLFGLASALSFALRNILSRKIVHHYGSIRLMLVTFVIASIVFIPWGVAQWRQLTLADLALLVVLGGALTAAPQAMLINTLKRLTSRMASIIVSLQPVVAIGLALLFLHEVPDAWTILGGAVIVTTVVATLAWKTRQPPRKRMGNLIWWSRAWR
ncbi:MAG: DMT family transporter [Phycisphaeraceae bacterium]